MEIAELAHQVLSREPRWLAKRKPWNVRKYDEKWQNPYVERLIGSVRRECLDHIIVWNERSLRRLQSYFAYYQRSRTHLALAKDAPESRTVEKPERGRIVVLPQVGGLHHRYQRHAA
jgi:putative transposase